MLRDTGMIVLFDFTSVKIKNRQKESCDINTKYNFGNIAVPTVKRNVPLSPRP
jgi:hypothetical protein